MITSDLYFYSDSRNLYNVPTYPKIVHGWFKYLLKLRCTSIIFTQTYSATRVYYEIQYINPNWFIRFKFYLNDKI